MQPFLFFRASLCVLLAFFAAGCASMPAWINKPVQEEGQYVYFTGVSYGEENMQIARDAAVKDAVKRISEALGMSVKGEFSTTLTEKEKKLFDVLTGKRKEADIYDSFLSDVWVKPSDGNSAIQVYARIAYSKKAFEKEKNAVKARSAGKISQLNEKLASYGKKLISDGFTPATALMQDEEGDPALVAKTREVLSGITLSCVPSQAETVLFEKGSKSFLVTATCNSDGESGMVKGLPLEVTADNGVELITLQQIVTDATGTAKIEFGAVTAAGQSRIEVSLAKSAYLGEKLPAFVFTITAKPVKQYSSDIYGSILNNREVFAELVKTMALYGIKIERGNKAAALQTAFAVEEKIERKTHEGFLVGFECRLDGRLILINKKTGKENERKFLSVFTAKKEELAKSSAEQEFYRKLNLATGELLKEIID